VENRFIGSQKLNHTNYSKRPARTNKLNSHFGLSTWQKGLPTQQDNFTVAWQKGKS